MVNSKTPQRNDGLVYGHENDYNTNCKVTFRIIHGNGEISSGKLVQGASHAHPTPQFEAVFVFFYG